MDNSMQMLDTLAILSTSLQFSNYFNIQNKVTTGQLMQELQKQDTLYLQTIIAQNEEILKILRQIAEKVL